MGMPCFTEMFRSRLNFGLDIDKVSLSLGALQTGTVQSTGGSVRQMGYVRASTFDVRRSMQPSTSLAVKLTTVSSALRFGSIEWEIPVTEDLNLYIISFTLYYLTLCIAGD